jgi:hypothetical protein
MESSRVIIDHRSSPFLLHLRLRRDGAASRGSGIRRFSVSAPGHPRSHIPEQLPLSQVGALDYATLPLVQQ